MDSLKALKEAYDILNQDNKLIPYFSSQSMKSINQTLASVHNIPANEKNSTQKAMEKLYVKVFRDIETRLKKLETGANNENVILKKPEL